MLGALGGITAVTMVLCKDGLRVGPIVLWILFTIAAFVHDMGVPI